MKKIIIILVLSLFVGSIIPYKLPKLLRYFSSVRICNNSNFFIFTTSLLNPLNEEYEYFTIPGKGQCSEYKNIFLTNNSVLKYSVRERTYFLGSHRYSSKIDIDSVTGKIKIGDYLFGKHTISINGFESKKILGEEEVIPEYSGALWYGINR